MHRLGVLVLLLPSLALAAPREVNEPENLPPSKQEQVNDAQVQAAESSTAPASYRKSVTLEASLGVGGVISSVDGVDNGLGLSGINLGIGGFLNPKLAITGRFAGVLTRGTNNVSLILVGGAVQYWIDDKLWVGGGLGLGYASLGGTSTSQNGFSFDLRGGYTIKQTRAHAFHVSVEVLPALFDGHLLTGIALLGGYQYL